MNLKKLDECRKAFATAQGAPMIQDTFFAIALGLAGATFLFLALS